MVVSLCNTPPYFANRDAAAGVARGCNDIYVDLHTRYPSRFNAFVGLPLPHVDAALGELDRALALPGVAGVGLGCSVLGKPLDDPAFDPLFAELNRREAVTFLHPVGAGGGPNSDDFGMTWMLASRFEDTIAMARLILPGLTLRYPESDLSCPTSAARWRSSFSGWTTSPSGRAGAISRAPISCRATWRAASGSTPSASSIRHSGVAARRSASIGSCWGQIGRCCRPRSSSIRGLTVSEALPEADAQKVLLTNAEALLSLRTPSRTS